MKTNIVIVDFKKNFKTIKGNATAQTSGFAKILSFIPRKPTLTEIIKNDHIITRRFNRTG